jgi:hypothetical protein
VNVLLVVTWSGALPLPTQVYVLVAETVMVVPSVKFPVAFLGRMTVAETGVAVTGVPGTLPVSTI